MNTSILFNSIMSGYMDKVPRFSGYNLTEEVTAKNREFLLPGCVGYKVDGVYGDKEFLPVTLGLIIPDGIITGIFYSKGDKLYKAGFVKEKFLDEIETIVEAAVSNLAVDRDVGCEQYLRDRFAERTPCLLTGMECISNEMTHNRVVKLDSVLVEFGYKSEFYSLLTGYARGKFILCLASRSYGVYCPRYEVYFDDKEKANYWYSKILSDNFVSKKGNTIYKVTKNRLKMFQAVTGSGIAIRG